MTVGFSCNPCANGTCGNCVAAKLETRGYIQNAKDHCSCANNGHPNNISKKNLNDSIFGSKKDTEPAHHRETQENSDDFEDVQ